MPYDCAFALINERLPLLVVKCSAISRRVFPALRTHRSLREPLPQFRCHHLALATQLALAQKALLLRFSFSFTSLIPSPILPRDEREKTERTTAQLPANKKCCLLIFAIAIGCLVLADFPASSLPVTLVHPVLPFPFLSAVMLSAISRRANLPLLVMRFAVPPARNPLSSTKNHPNYRFLFVFMQKFLYLCR